MASTPAEKRDRGRLSPEGGWRELKRRLTDARLPGRAWLIGLDFDGTLAPLAKRPHLARLSPDVRRLLARLARRPWLRVAVVSGRSLEDVRARVGLRGIHYAGNHGLQIQGPGFRWAHPAARAALNDARELALALRGRLRGLPGLLVEEKGPTLSFHYRQLSPRNRPRLRRLLGRALEPFAGRLALSSGKMLWEVRPAASWNKGHALLKLAGRLGGGLRLLFAGDDRTDEEGFRVLGRRAVTVRVGPAQRTAARFCLQDRRRIPDLLKLLGSLEPPRLRCGASPPGPAPIP